jgi:hypothetical protein
MSNNQNTIIEEAKVEASYTDMPAYKSQLRDVLWSMVKSRPDLYNVIDYLEACNEAGILAF